MDLEVFNPAALDTLGRAETAVQAKQSNDKAIMYLSVGKEIMETFDIIKMVGDGRATSEEQDVLFYKRKDEGTYKLLGMPQLGNMCARVLASRKHFMVNRDVEECAKTIKRYVMKTVSSVNNYYHELPFGMFWDAEEGELTDNIGEKRCFHRLFDTDVEDSNIVKVEGWTEADKQTMLERYEQVKQELEDGVEEERYDFIKVWANNSHDVYTDLMKAMASCFLKNMPVGSYILPGERRNGKSTFIGMMHTIMGRNNTSATKLTQLADPHYANELQYTVMNAPDEEDEKVLDGEATTNFKTIAAHGTVDLSVMRSNRPIKVACNFMCFYPMNHLPEWKGSTVSACIKRSLIIPFYNDLSKYDNGHRNFAKDTFTHEVMADLLGSIFAYAYYYSRHDLEFSKSMKAEQELMRTESDSGTEYREQFLKCFDGVSSLSFLYDDYYYWCKAHDLRAQTKKELRFLFHRYITKTNETSVRSKTGRVQRAYRFQTRPNGTLMMPDTEIGEQAIPISELHEKMDSSAVEVITAYMERKRIAFLPKSEQGKLDV